MEDERLPPTAGVDDVPCDLNLQTLPPFGQYLGTCGETALMAETPGCVREVLRALVLICEKLRGILSPFR